jgi:hypothetical protein
MRRFGLLLSVVALALLSLVWLTPPAITHAQDAMPLEGGLAFEIAPGVTAGILTPKIRRRCIASSLLRTLSTHSQQALPSAWSLSGPALSSCVWMHVTVMRAGANDAPGSPQ